MTSSPGDQITLLRRVEGEYAPRVYSLRGQDFQSLLAAVKSLPSRKFEEHLFFKYWRINGEGLRLLRARDGLVIVAEPDIQCSTVDHALLTRALRERGTGEATIDLAFHLRGSDGTFAANVAAASATLALYLDDAYCAAVKLEISEQRVQWGFSGEPTAKDILLLAAGQAVREYELRMQKAFQSALGKRTREDFHTALQVVQRLVDEDARTDLNAFSGAILDEQPRLLPGDHLLTQQMALASAARRAEEKTQARAAREAREAERRANAPTHVQEWFGRLTKAEIVTTCSQRGGLVLHEKEVEKTTKAALIARIVADHALCERIVTSSFL